MTREKIQSIIESILFVSGEPMKRIKLAKIADATIEEMENAIKSLSEKYSVESSGLALLEKGDEIQLVTKAENNSHVENIIKSELADSLSQAALEVVSIIGYRGPISKAEIELIRGVNCSYTLRNLMLRGLIEKSENPKDSRGYVYSISFDFLKTLGIENVEKMPDYAILSMDKRIEAIIPNQSENQTE